MIYCSKNWIIGLHSCRIWA